MGADRAGPAGRLRCADAGGGDGGLARVRRSASTIALFAETNLATMPDRTLGRAGRRRSETESVWWQGIRRRLQQFTGDPDRLIDTVGREMTDRLSAVLDRYEPTSPNWRSRRPADAGPP